MVNLNSRTSLHPRWEHSGDSALSGFYVATVQVINPHTDEYGADFDPGLNTATGGRAEVLWQGQGQIQQFRSTLNAIAPVSAYTEIQSVRFTAARDELDIPVRKGFQLRVTSCPKRPQLQLFQFTIVSGLESALAFSRDIEAEADQGVTLGN